jgi:uncharacterized OB-fold protein
MNDRPEKFFPTRRPGTVDYWDACQRHELLIQRCNKCATHQFYPRIFCTTCSSKAIDWVSASGHGKVLTWTVVRRAVSAAYAADDPYIIALIKLQEGPVMMSKVIGCEPESMQTGMAVEISFEDWSEQVSMPVFVPATGFSTNTK